MQHEIAFEAAIARIAASERNSSRSALDRIPASLLDRTTGYRAHGLTAAHVRDLIHVEAQRQACVQARRSAARPGAVSEPGAVLRKVEEKQENLRTADAQFAACTPFLEAQARRDRGQVRIGDAILRGVEVGEWNHDRYSRSWHRQHGGVWEVSERRVDLLQIGRLGRLEVSRSVSIDGFRGHWLQRAAVELLDLPTIKVARELRPVQLDPHCEVHLIRRLGAVAIYGRTLAGVPLDVCVTANGETFHAATIRGAIEGLRRKRTAATRASERQRAEDAQVVAAVDGARLGFCRAGMEAFCSANGLDIDGRYTRAHLRKVVASRRSMNLLYWGAELRRIGLA